MHGKPEARLDRQRSMFEPEDPSHGPTAILRWIVSPVFFNLPLQYLEDLEKIWVDRTVNYRPWRIFISKLQRDWENSITPVSVNRALSCLQGCVGVLIMSLTGDRALDCQCRPARHTKRRHWQSGSQPSPDLKLHLHVPQPRQHHTLHYPCQIGRAHV